VAATGGLFGQAGASREILGSAAMLEGEPKTQCEFEQVKMFSAKQQSVRERFGKEGRSPKYPKLTLAEFLQQTCLFLAHRAANPDE
jgi:hypothetical protein